MLTTKGHIYGSAFLHVCVIYVQYHFVSIHLKNKVANLVPTNMFRIVFKRFVA